MNLMKWLRKNNKKLMAIVVIVLMVAFIGGSSLHYLLQGSGGVKDALAYYGRQHKITHLDRMAADQEIRILEALGIEGILRSQDLRGLLLSQLVFRENREGATIDMARQAIQRNRYRISDAQLQEIFTDRSLPPDMCWILLYEEARTAGIHVSNDEVGQLLERLIPQLTRGGTYKMMIESISNRFNVPEDEILTAFGKLMAVLQYAQVVTSAQNVTAAQIRHMARDESESLSAEFVRFRPSYFADKQQTPPDAALTEQFNKYKDNFPGAASGENPFGFGYRLPDRVQFEYLLVKLSDVAAITKPPTEEEGEQYYQQNRDEQYTDQVPADPNDPNSPQVPKVRSYAEVADAIMKQLRQQRIATKAEQILQEAKNLADAELRLTDAQGRQPTLEQRKEKAGDYAKIAADLGRKHNLAIYSGRTGQLAATTIQGDKVLRRMFLTGYGYNPTPLSQVLFSVKELGEGATILLSMPQAEMYASIGPAQDPMSGMGGNLADQVMMIARVVAVEKNAPPAGLDASFSTRTLGLDEPAGKKDPVFSVREQVVTDVRALAAWDTAHSKAEEFMALATKDGWDKAVAQFNQRYGAQAKAEPNDPNVFQVENQAGLQRIPPAEMQVLTAQLANSPGAQIVLNQAREAAQFVDLLYAQIPAQADAPPHLPLLLESKGGQSFYVLKNLAVQRLHEEDFQKSKGTIVRREEYGQMESLAAVHFNPADIVQRMNFRFVHPADEPAGADANSQSQSKEAS